MVGAAQLRVLVTHTTLVVVQPCWLNWFLEPNGVTLSTAVVVVRVVSGEAVTLVVVRQDEMATLLALVQDEHNELDVVVEPPELDEPPPSKLSAPVTPVFCSTASAPCTAAIASSSTIGARYLKGDCPSHTREQTQHGKKYM